MKNNANVAIILPNYNSHLYLNETIKSIINQSYTKWRLIIVDDCSNKKTKDLLKKFDKKKKIKIYWLQKNRGAGYCRNFAIKKTNLKYLAFIDSDDIWKKHKLKNQINYMEKNNFDFTYTYYETFGNRKKFVTPPKKLNFIDFVKNTSIGTSTMIVKTKAAKQISFTNTKICEDYYYKCKILKKVKYAYCLDQFLTKYRIRNDSLQGSSLKNIYWIWKINKKYNNMSFLQNLISLIFISINSIRKYGFKSF